MTKKGKVTCAVRCNACTEFGSFENYTKADGHFRGVFICKPCREKGVPFPGEGSTETVKKKPKKIKEEKIKKKEDLGITSLLNPKANKPAKKK